MGSSAYSRCTRAVIERGVVETRLSLEPRHSFFHSLFHSFIILLTHSLFHPLTHPPLSRTLSPIHPCMGLYLFGRHSQAHIYGETYASPSPWGGIRMPISMGRNTQAHIHRETYTSPCLWGGIHRPISMGRHTHAHYICMWRQAQARI